MKIEYHNLYTHFILVTKNRIPLIAEKNRERVEKYIAGIINNNNSKLDSISDVNKVRKYILNQPHHHRKISFAEEYDEFVKYYQKTLKWEII